MKTPKNVGVFSYVLAGDPATSSVRNKFLHSVHSKNKAPGSSLVLVILAAMTLFATQACAAPYLVEYCWGGHNTPAYVANHISFVESRPFDGIVLSLPLVGSNLFNPDFTVGNRQSTGGVWTYQQCSDDLSPLTASSFNKFKHNFVIVGMGGPSDPPDVFDDWSWIITSFQNFCQALKDRGIQGVALDDEVYSYLYWMYPDNVKYASTYTLQQYVNQAKLRGTQLMQAAIAVYPNIVIMPLHGSFMGCTAAMTGNAVGCWASDNWLSGAFDAGIIAAAGNQSLVVDGGELYELSTPQDFQNAYIFRKYTIAIPVVTCLFMDSALRSMWRQACSVGFGVYDHKLTSNGYVMRTDMTEVQNVLTAALQACDNYTWHYSEGIDWWAAPGDVGAIPAPTQGWINAVAGAQTAVSGQNQLQNPGFENQNAGWGDWGYRNAVSAPSSAVHSGTWGMGIAAGSSYGGTYQIVPAVPNAFYTLSGWGKQTVNDGTSSLGAECLDSNNNVIGTQSQVFSGTDYSWYSLGFTAPANTAKILVYLWKGTGSGSLYADDLSLVSEPIVRNELQNSNFEGGNTGWSSWGYSSVIQNPSLAHSGAWLMGVSTTNPNGGGAYQIVSAVPNAIYALSGWGKQTVNDGTSFLGAQCLDSSNNLIAGTSQSQVFSGTDYSQYSCSITTPWNTAKIQVFLWKGAGSGGYLYADDLNLSLVQTGLNQLQNPGFENQNVGWGDWGYRNAVNTPSSAVHSGTWGMGITAGSSYGGTYQIVPAVPNAIYGLSGWGKQTVDDGTSSFGAECLDSNNNVIGIPQSQVFSGTNYSWYLFGFTTPANTAKILVYLWKGVGSGSLYADDLYLLKY